MLYLTLLMILLPVCVGVLVYRFGDRQPKLAYAGVMAVLAVEMLASIALIRLEDAAATLPEVCGLGISFSASGLQIGLCIVASFMWLVSGIFSGGYMAHDEKKHRYYFFYLLTEGAILGVFLSADLYTTLIFFETMSFVSYPLVVHKETREAVRAGGSYLCYAVVGGMVSLMGLFLLWNLLGTLRYDELFAAAAACNAPVRLYVAGGLAMVTFIAKACMWPLHTWLPSAHPVAPSPASALLSGIITKAGIFGIFAISSKLFLHDARWGEVLVLFATATMVWGGFQALCHTNLKRILAYSTMSQIGFILVGVGMQGLLGEENGMAVWGSTLHLVNHALFKLLFFLTAGIIDHTLGKLDLNDIQGFGRKKPVLQFLLLMPAMGIAGVPLWNGYLSKTLLHESIVEYTQHLAHLGESTVLFQAVEWLFLLAGGMTAAYMAKIFICICVQRNRDPAVQERYDKTHMHTGPEVLAVLGGCAALCPILGMTPHILLETAARFCQGFFLSTGPEHTVAYFSAVNLRGAAISLGIGLAIYLAAVFPRRDDYRILWPQAISLEQGVYQPLLFRVLPFCGALCARVAANLFEWMVLLGNKILFFRYDPIVHAPEDGYFARYRAKIKGVRGYRSQIAYGLALFGMGFVVVMVYLLWENCL